MNEEVKRCLLCGEELLTEDEVCSSCYALEVCPEAIGGREEEQKELADFRYEEDELEYYGGEGGDWK